MLSLDSSTISKARALVPSIVVGPMTRKAEASGLSGSDAVLEIGIGTTDVVFVEDLSQRCSGCRAVFAAHILV